MKLTFKGDKLTIKSKDQMKEITFKLDATKKPKEMDVDFDGKTGKGLYQLDGDTLKIVFNVSDLSPSANSNNESTFRLDRHSRYDVPLRGRAALAARYQSF